MKDYIKEYTINEEENGRLTLKLELKTQPLGKKDWERGAFTTNDALHLLVEEGYCTNIGHAEVIKGGIAWNWGGSPNKADWTFRVRGTKKTTAKKQPVKATPAAKKEPAKKVKTTKTDKPKTTQDILASIKSKGN